MAACCLLIKNSPNYQVISAFHGIKPYRQLKIWTEDTQNTILKRTLLSTLIEKRDYELPDQYPITGKTRIDSKLNTSVGALNHFNNTHEAMSKIKCRRSKRNVTWKLTKRK